MKYTEFVQCGNKKQCVDNGMSQFIYSIGAGNGRGGYAVLEESGLETGCYWSIHKSYATSFKLVLIF